MERGRASAAACVRATYQGWLERAFGKFVLLRARHFARVLQLALASPVPLLQPLNGRHAQLGVAASATTPLPLATLLAAVRHDAARLRTPLVCITASAVLLLWVWLSRGAGLSTCISTWMASRGVQRCRQHTMRAMLRELPTRIARVPLFTRPLALGVPTHVISMMYLHRRQARAAMSAQCHTRRSRRNLTGVRLEQRTPLRR